VWRERIDSDQRIGVVIDRLRRICRKDDRFNALPKNPNTGTFGDDTRHLDDISAKWRRNLRDVFSSF
jgi:hypothetical protein